MNKKSYSTPGVKWLQTSGKIYNMVGAWNEVIEQDLEFFTEELEI